MCRGETACVRRDSFANRCSLVAVTVKDVALCTPSGMPIKCFLFVTVQMDFVCNHARESIFCFLVSVS